MCCVFLERYLPFLKGMELNRVVKIVSKTYNPTVSVIIPTLNAGKELDKLLCILEEQTYPIKEIYVVDSESTDETVSICRKSKNVKLVTIKRNDFDHGRTRDMVLRQTTGEVVVFITQDCLPANNSFVEELIRPLEKSNVAVSTGRQLPKANATEIERLIRLFNYPIESGTRSIDDIPKLGIKTFFCSDVCAAYKRGVYIELGGFDYPVKTNEDMFFAAKAINAGYQVYYASKAEVFHSHNFSLKQQYRRNYLQGYEIERHKEILKCVSQDAEGFRLVKFVSCELLKRLRIFSFIYFGFDCITRYIGSKNGRNKARHEMQK